MTGYQEFLESKTVIEPEFGTLESVKINPMLYPFQADIVRWALRRGRACIFADCGLGKTPMQLSWAENIPGKVLILAPLAVSDQTIREGEKFGIDVRGARDQSQVTGKITITNYEMLSHFEPGEFSGIVLDESSIIKNFDGKLRGQIIEMFRDTSYRLACTATPAPNDYMELGNHSEFVGAMTRTEMLSMFFVHDGGETQKWRIKGHAQDKFWTWVCSWAVLIRKPSDLKYEDSGFNLPPIYIHEHLVEANSSQDGFLFPMEAKTLQERQGARRESISERVSACAEKVNSSHEPWVVWCNLNSESDALKKAIPDSVEVRGSDSREVKESRLLDFGRGRVRVMVTKPSIAGFGLNWQHCPNMAFVGLSDSFEQYYQATRRCWRFGQDKPVNVHIITARTEGAVVSNIKRKEKDAEEMIKGMLANMKDINADEVRGEAMSEVEGKAVVKEGPEWKMIMGDCVDVVGKLEPGSIHYSIFSPPFSSLYTYTDSEKDMGNSRDDREFYEHFRFLVKELYRVILPGRLVSFHCMNLQTTKTHFGYIGIRDFRGEMIRLFEAEGFIYHSEVCIWKDPVIAMQRTKALGLLYKQLKKDSAMSRQGIPDYLVTMRKPGDNPEAVTKDPEDFPVSVWQRYASPIWTDINPSDTLAFRSVREHKDDKHICPLQLTVIQRGVEIWTNPGDTVLSPFAGIGSEGYVAVNLGRRFLGVELKGSYFRQACENMKSARGGDLFSGEAT